MKITTETISNAARELQKKRWENVSKKDKSDYGKMMAEAKKNKKKISTVVTKEALQSN